MDEVGEGPELLLEAVDGIAVDATQRLQGDGRVALTVEGLVDDAEAALPEPPLEREAARPSEGIGLGIRHLGWLILVRRFRRSDPQPERRQRPKQSASASNPAFGSHGMSG